MHLSFQRRSLSWRARAGHGAATRARFRREARHRPVRDVVQRRGAATVRPRDGAAPFLRVWPRDRRVHRGRHGRSRLRDRLLGHRAQPLGQSVRRRHQDAGASSRRAATRSPRARRSARRPTASATTLPPRRGSSPTSRRSTSARGSSPTAMRCRIWRRGMPTIPRRRRSTRWRWRRRTIRPTRPTPA